MGRVIFWDFDGTLGYRGRGGARFGFSTCLVEVLEAHTPGHGIDRRAFHPFLQAGFPWHAPDMSHVDLCEPDAWWAALNPVFAKALEGVGIDAEVAATLCENVRARYADPDEWELYDDVLPVLTQLAEQGWRHVIVSNHVPELPAISSGLGLDDLVERVHTSAITGYEKPHPEMFRIAMRDAGEPAEAWMVGDNPIADHDGAERCGINGILVRYPYPGDRRSAPDLWGAATLIAQR